MADYKNRIMVTKSFSAPYEEFAELDKISYNSGVHTNQGPYILRLESELKKFLNVENCHFVSNGTIALQLAIKSLEMSRGEIITTPFSYVATSSAILWEGFDPVFCDIEDKNFTIDHTKIEKCISKNTRAILATNVYGYVCNFQEIEKIAKQYNIKVIYDSAHCFGVKYQGKSVFDFGDISTCSFHSTKLFHTREGGAVFTKDRDLSSKIDLIKRFGHIYDDHKRLGINAKNTESNAIAGIANLKYVKDIIKSRSEISLEYKRLLKGYVKFPHEQEGLEYNFSYFPVVFDSEKELLKSLQGLQDHNIFPRRYFYPSLNKIPYINSTDSCPISEGLSKRVLCLPLWPFMDMEIPSFVAKIIKNTCR